MTSFPLFDNLLKDAVDKDLNVEEKEKFTEKIKKMDKNGYELLYTLIKIYQVQEGDPSSFIIPYNGKQLKSGVRFDLDSFPNRLKQILYKFLNLHLSSMEENKKLGKFI